jgi:hypothetical protein
VAGLPLARVPNARAPEPSPAGTSDYRGAFDPKFKLGNLSTATLCAVAREFQIQCHLLASSAELTLTERIGRDKARDVLAGQWTGVSWVAAQRLGRALGVDGGSDAIAAVLKLVTPLAPGFARKLEASASGVRLTLEPASAELLDPENPGWVGLLVRGNPRGLEAMAQAVEPRAALRGVELRNGRVEAEFEIDPEREPAATPREAALMRFSSATRWDFDTSAERLGR